MTIDELKALYDMVWKFRAEMKDDFPTPPPIDSLRFAVTESGEAIDAQLRLNPIYKRNNDKAHSVPRELTQCAMMLLTAVPLSWKGWDGLETYQMVAVWTPDNIALRVTGCLAVPSDYAYIIQTVAAINTAVNLSETLPAELDRMRAKHKSSSNGHGGALVDVRRVGQLAIGDYADGAGVD